MRNLLATLQGGSTSLPQGLGLNPAMPGLRLNLGLALFKAGDLREAIQTFDVLLNNEPPSSPEARRLRTLMGLAHYGLQEYAAAVPYLKEATASDPQNLPFRLGTQLPLVQAVSMRSRCVSRDSAPKCGVGRGRYAGRRSLG